MAASAINERIAAATKSILDILQTGTIDSGVVYYDENVNTKYNDVANARNTSVNPPIPAKPSSTKVKECLQAFVDQEDVDDLTKRYLLGAIEDLCETFNAFHKTLVKKHKDEYSATTYVMTADRLNSGSPSPTTWTDKTADAKYTGSWDKLYDDFAEAVMTHPLYLVMYHFEKNVWTDASKDNGGLLSWMHYLYQAMYNKDAARFGTVTDGQGNMVPNPLPNTLGSNQHIADRKWALYGRNYLFTRRLTGASNTISNGSPPLPDWWTSSANGNSACWNLAVEMQEHYLTREPELCPDTGLVSKKDHEKATGCPSDQFCWDKTYVYIAGGAFGLILVLMLLMMVR